MPYLNGSGPILRLFVGIRVFALAAVLGAQPAPSPPAFEVATIKPVQAEAKSSRYIKMEGVHRFVAKDYTLKLLIAAAYDLSPKTISGGPGWMELDHFNIVAVTPGEVPPPRDQQMAMLRSLLVERFALTFHREPRQFSIYALEIVKTGEKLKQSTAPREAPAALISTVYPDHVLLPARNATMADLASLLQRAVLDRPVVDRTRLAGRWDFDLDWTPDETQFGGDLPTPLDTARLPLFLAMERQLGLHLEPTRGPVQALIVDRAERPAAN